MASKVNLSDVLKNGTPKQKALLIIQNDEASQKIGGGFLTEKEVESILHSVKGKPTESRELYKYLRIAEKYSMNRFRFYGLRENLAKLSARIAALTFLWEQAEHEAEVFNTLLGLMDCEDTPNCKAIPHKKDMETYIYRSCKSWNRWINIERKEGSRDVEVNLSTLRTLLDDIVASYASSLAVAKAYCEASDEFVAKYRVSAFIPSDIKEMIQYFKSPNTDVPEIYRRDSYLKLLREKGEDDREVQFRKKYAILPAYEEVEPVGGTNARELFTL